jgi:hypothetical protein
MGVLDAQFLIVGVSLLVATLWQIYNINKEG